MIAYYEYIKYIISKTPQLKISTFKMQRWFRAFPSLHAVIKVNSSDNFLGIKFSTQTRLKGITLGKDSEIYRCKSSKPCFKAAYTELNFRFHLLSLNFNFSLFIYFIWWKPTSFIFHYFNGILSNNHCTKGSRE